MSFLSNFSPVKFAILCLVALGMALGAVMAASAQTENSDLPVPGPHPHFAIQEAFEKVEAGYVLMVAAHDAVVAAYETFVTASTDEAEAQQAFADGADGAPDTTSLGQLTAARIEAEAALATSTEAFETARTNYVMAGHEYSQLISGLSAEAEAAAEARDERIDDLAEANEALTAQLESAAGDIAALAALVQAMMPAIETMCTAHGHGDYIETCGILADGVLQFSGDATEGNLPAFTADDN